MQKIEPFLFEKRVNRASKLLGQILIVDDSVADIVGPYHLLHYLGYKVQLAFDGQDALESLARQKYDLIVLDLNMPLIGGHQVLMALNSMKRFSSTKIILYTGEQVSLEIKESYKNVDIIDVWKKPLQVPQIAAKLKRVG